MNLTIKQRILFLVGIIAVSSLLGNIVLINNARNFASRLKAQTERSTRQLIEKRAAEIEASMLMIEKKADDLATGGETFLHIHQTTQQNITPEIQNYLVANITKSPETIGGGLWYQPYAFSKDRKYFGLYAFWKGQKVVFTWDLNTPEYDYPNQNWYRAAIPKNWDVQQNRPQRIYWSEPYRDESATHSPMITVDALMYNTAKQIVGIATVDLSLKHLQQMVARINVTPTSTAFAVDGSSQEIVAFPKDSSQIMHPASSMGWGKYIARAEDLRPDTVTEKQIVLHGRDYSLFYTITRTDMILGILAPNDELFANIDRLRQTGLLIAIVVVAAQIIVCLLIGWTLMRRICNPISALTGVAKTIAAGDLLEASQRLQRIGPDIQSVKDETGQLMTAFQSMTESLSALVGQTQLSGVQVSTSSAEIATSARQLEATVAEQLVSTRQVTATTRDISTTSEELVQTMDEMSKTVTETAALAETGQTALTRMESTVDQLVQATRTIASKLAIINDKANKISGIVSTINKISEQTNLLSLNAAIEAEKAGEYGKGFAVVAREIRRLADQTAVATQNIEQMVREMESSVSGGVMEMDNFAQHVKEGGKAMATIAGQLGIIIDQVQDLAPKFDDVKLGMHAHSGGAQNISEAMEQLSLGASQTRESLHEFNLATQQLNDAVQGLQDQVSLFKINES